MSPQAVIPDPLQLANGPDLAGFADAQDRLRIALGQDIIFLIPQAKTWPSGTALDPETGEPYDPTTVPTSGSTPDEVEKRVNVIYKPLTAGGPDEASFEAAGILHTKGCALLVSPSDWPDVEDATDFIVNERTFHITDSVPDGLTDTLRYIVFGEPK